MRELLFKLTVHSRQISTIFFAGIHLGWRLFIVGIFLGLALIGATYLEEFVWMFLIIALVVVAIFLLLKRYARTN